MKVGTSLKQRNTSLSETHIVREEKLKKDAGTEVPSNIKIFQNKHSSVVPFPNDKLRSLRDVVTQSANHYTTEYW